MFSLIGRTNASGGLLFAVDDGEAEGAIEGVLGLLHEQEEAAEMHDASIQWIEANRDRVLKS